MADALTLIGGRFRSRETDATGSTRTSPWCAGATLALFDGAERAVRGAKAMVRGIEEIELRIRAGVHTGEVEYLPGNVRGMAVHIASRVMALADPGQVLVSDTTRA